MCMVAEDWHTFLSPTSNSTLATLYSTAHSTRSIHEFNSSSIAVLPTFLPTLKPTSSGKSLSKSMTMVPTIGLDLL